MTVLAPWLPTSLASYSEKQCHVTPLDQSGRILFNSYFPTTNVARILMIHRLNAGAVLTEIL